MDAHKVINKPQGCNAVLMLSKGAIFWGQAVGAKTTRFGELCFNTSMTGYQEIMTDPSYTGQMIVFTFPHIGNVGINFEDNEGAKAGACGCIVRQPLTQPSNYRAKMSFDAWLNKNDVPGICGVDTRHLTHMLREQGSKIAVLCTQIETTTIAELQKELEDFDADRRPPVDKAGVRKVSSFQNETIIPWNMKTERNMKTQPDKVSASVGTSKALHIIVIDYGIKYNILRELEKRGATVTIVPADFGAREILALKPDGVFLSNGPFDPKSIAQEAVPIIQELLNKSVPIFGICMGHQLLALAIGAQTYKMDFGHRGANHPIYDRTTQKVEITSQNHGYVVDAKSLPKNAQITHHSLFDGTVAGLQLTDKPAFSVQYHPEASPGPHDSHYLFDRFLEKVKNHKVT